MRRKLQREIDGIKPFTFTYNKDELINPFKCVDGKKYYKDTYWWTNEGYLVKVIEYYDKNYIEIEFQYNGYRRYVKLAELKYGAIRNPYHRNQYGGYFGEGPYGKRSHIKIYNSWSKMLERNTLKGQLNNRRNSSYVNCSVCNEWYNYQNFAYWYDNYISTLNPLYYNDYQLDKDILQWNQEYKIYSPNTCCLIPSEINLALGNLHTEATFQKGLPPGVQLKGYEKYEVAVSMNGKIMYGGHYDNPYDAFEKYKSMKIDYIKQLADFYYNKQALHKDIYDILYNLEIIPYGMK